MTDHNYPDDSETTRMREAAEKIFGSNTKWEPSGMHTTEIEVSERELTTQEKVAKLAAEVEADFCLDGDVPTTLRSTCIDTTDDRGTRRLEITIVVEHNPRMVKG